MAEWILIWVLMGNHEMTSGTQEFYTKKACEMAAIEIKKAGILRIGVGDVVVCVPKGERSVDK